MNLPNYDDYVRRRKVLKQLIDEETYREVAHIAGSLTPALFESIEKAAELLQHDSPNLRKAAIHVLAYYWSIRPNGPIAETIRSMARSDVDVNVKREALSGGACIYAGTDDVELGELLARKVLDEVSGIDSREEAYHGLRRLQHRWQPLKLSLSFSFPSDVDWAYVRRFLDISRTPVPVDPKESFVEVFLNQERKRDQA